MDLFTHILFAYAGVTGAVLWRRGPGGLDQRATALACAAAAAAMAPDLDSFLAPFSRWPQLYFLQHRGATHSLVGAPLSGAATVWLLGRLSRRWPRLWAWRWRPGFPLAILFGSWSHVLLDGVAHHGVPALWPVVDRAYSLEIYYWIVWWLAPVSLVPLVLRWRGRWSNLRVLQAGVVVVLILVVVAGIRIAARPNADAFAQNTPFEWITAHQEENGTWRLELVRGEAVLDRAWYEPTAPEEAADAIAQVRQTWSYRGFLMASTGPLVVHAEPAPAVGPGRAPAPEMAGGAGGPASGPASAVAAWNITILDALQRFELRQAPAWVPERYVEQAGILRAQVTGDGVRILRS